MGERAAANKTHTYDRLGGNLERREQQEPEQQCLQLNTTRIPTFTRGDRRMFSDPRADRFLPQRASGSRADEEPLRGQKRSGAGRSEPVCTTLRFVPRTDSRWNWQHPGSGQRAHAERNRRRNLLVHYAGRSERWNAVVVEFERTAALADRHLFESPRGRESAIPVSQSRSRTCRQLRECCSPSERPVYGLSLRKAWNRSQNHGARSAAAFRDTVRR